MFDFFDNHMEPFKQAARKAPKGLAPEQLVPGAMVTMSACKVTGDRSWTHDIYEVVAANACQVLVRPTQLLEKDYCTDGKPRMIIAYEREFYTADHLVDAIQAGQAP